MNSLIKHHKSIIPTLVLICLLSSSLFAQQKKEIKPKRFVNVVYMTGSSDFIYYALSSKSKTTIEVEGPGKLTVYNRARLEKNEEFSTPYYLKYMIDDKLITSKKIGPQQRSSKIKYKNKLVGTPSKVEKEIIKIPPGKHTISFFKHKAKHKAHVRFMYQKEEKILWKEMTSLNSLSPVTIQYVKTQKEQTYHRITNKKGFVFNSGDSKKLRVFLRADFNYKMHSQNILRFVVKQNGKEIGAYKVTCKKSPTVENTTDKNLIPGILERVFIELPKLKKQQYEILLKDPNKSAMIRVFLDKKSTGKNKST